MKPVAILYATREGHTRRIAEHVAAAMRARGLPADVLEVVAESGLFSPERHAAVVLAASVHGGVHEPEMVSFVRRHRDELENLPSAFLSVSLTEATAEDEARPPDARREAGDDVRAMLETFFKSTGWHPGWAKPVAGALPYSRYGALKRFVMKQIVRRSGGPTDTSRDYEFTDWASLDRFIDEFVADLTVGAMPAQAVLLGPRGLVEALALRRCSGVAAPHGARSFRKSISTWYCPPAGRVLTSSPLS